MQASSIYFDNNGTTRLDSRVLQGMMPWLTEQHGNPASRHAFGRAARSAIDHARQQVAESVGAHPSQVIFTSGGTEADNLAISGMATAPGTIAISAIEHPAVSRPAFAMRQRGFRVNTVAVDHDGRLDMHSFENSLRLPTSLVSVMLANNETGVIQDIHAIAEIAKERGAYMHTDAVQALGKMKVDFSGLNVHAMTVSSHKINGPQGAGALIVDKRVDLQPLIYGGGQEKGLRSGTENVAAIVGFGLACELAIRELGQRTQAMQTLRERLELGLGRIGAIVFGKNADRLPNTSFFAIPHIEGETLVMALDRQGCAVASGSACSSDSTEPSHVLLAMGVEPDLARGAVRISFGKDNTADEVDAFLAALENELARLKRLAAIAV